MIRCLCHRVVKTEGCCGWRPQRAPWRICERHSKWQLKKDHGTSHLATGLALGPGSSKLFLSQAGAGGPSAQGQQGQSSGRKTIGRVLQGGSQPVVSLVSLSEAAHARSGEAGDLCWPLGQMAEILCLEFSRCADPQGLDCLGLPSVVWALAG